MGYVNLSIHVGKTSKKVSGQKNFYGPVQGPSKLKSEKFSELKLWNFLLHASNLALK